MDTGRAVPWAVGGLATILGAAGLVTLAVAEPPEIPHRGYEERRVYVDASDQRRNYLTGDEMAGDPFMAADFELDDIDEYALSDSGASEDSAG